MSTNAFKCPCNPFAEFEPLFAPFTKSCYEENKYVLKANITQYSAVRESQDRDDEFSECWNSINQCNLAFLFHGVRMGMFALCCWFAFNQYKALQGKQCLSDFDIDSGTLLFETPSEGMYNYIRHKNMLNISV